MTPKHADGSNAYRADDDPDSWQDVHIPMDHVDWRRAKVIYGFLLHYEVMPAAERSGLQFKDIHFMLKE